MLNLCGNSFSEVYHELLNKLINSPEFVVSPRGEKVSEIVNCELKIDNPLACLYKNDRRSSQLKYISAELLWYLSGDLTTTFIKRYSKFWEKLKNTDETINSNYGWLLFYEKMYPEQMSQWEWAYNCLINDKDTRQAVMHFNLPKHQYSSNKDFVCTMYGDFLIRDNKLHFTIHMRSNDVILGLPTDIPFFCLLQINMWNLLKDKYEGLELGSYTHFVNSMHLYGRNYDLVNEMLNHEFIPEEMHESCKLMINEKGRTSSFVNEAKQHLLYGFANNPVMKTEFENFIWYNLNKN